MSARPPAPRRPVNTIRRPGAPASGSGVRRPGQLGGGQTSRPSASSGVVTSRGNDDGYLYVAGVRDPSKRMTEYRTEEDTCPVCHTDRQFDKNLRLLVSPCYHKMCESCIDRLFTLGPAPCPQCQKVLRKANFAHQTFEDLKVEKEISVRRRMAENFNKRADDFPTRKEYDDYLEDVEDMTFNLLNDIDVAATEARIAAYARDNASLIATNQHKAAMESLSQNEREDIERRARAERMRMIEEAERVEAAEEARARSAAVEAISRGSSEDANAIMSKYHSAKEARAAALAATVPPSLAALYGSKEDDTEHSPTSPSYAGPYVPIPYSDPDKADYTHWYDAKDSYADGRSGVIWAKEDREGKVRGGGWDLQLFWEMEIRSAVESLSIEPLRD
ncbi:TFIIH/NER complex subunit [Vanrija albida]|uniref:RNA polymerase II transcription factor B subunit 3 n=1 Tax=Vanrija albida TaxID=181172 RepID=A0ABR3Q2T6_9TREE